MQGLEAHQNLKMTEEEEKKEDEEESVEEGDEGVE